MQNLSRPQTVSQLQRFLGTVNYYRYYIQNIASIAGPLYSLTRKGVKWDWDAGCEEAFQHLRRVLSGDPVTLAFPDWRQAFHIETDACGTGIGAVLGQMDEATQKVRTLEYALSPSQRIIRPGNWRRGQ